MNADAKKMKGVKVTRKFQRILEATVQFDSTKTCYLRFWVKNYTKDMIVRSQLLIIQANTNHQILEEKYSDIFRHIKSFNGDWALIEIPLVVKQSNEIIKLLFKNSVLDGKEFYFDEFTISQVGLTED
jgi:hypothetical protein